MCPPVPVLRLMLPAQLSQLPQLLALPRQVDGPLRAEPLHRHLVWQQRNWRACVGPPARNDLVEQDAECVPAQRQYRQYSATQYKSGSTIGTVW